MNNKLNQLAFKYFDGIITGDEERSLFQMIQSAEGLKEFRLAEQKWQESTESSTQVNQQWNRLRSRISVFDSMKTVAPRRRRLNPWLFTTIAASFVIAILGIVILQTPEPSYITFEAPPGSRSKTVLPDSSVVWLNSGSKLAFANSFGKNNRELKLTGEGYFEVFHNEESPFVVHTDVCDITVLGTRFNVTSYEEDDIVRTSVVDGKVRISNGIQAVSITKGQSVEYSKKAASFTRKNTGISSIAAWTENRLEYADITLRELADIVSRNYNVQIVITADKYANEHLSISLRNNETLDEVLDGIRRVLPVTVKRQNNIIYLQ